MPFTQYLSELQKNLAARNATEHTHRSALEKLIESLEKNITATNEPKREECGAPDYVVARKAKGLALTIGYIEAKDIGASLDKIEKSEQLKRYRKALPNLILTNYLEFRWYVLGERRLSARLATVDSRGKIKSDQSGTEQVAELLKGFLSQKPLDINKPKELAQRLALLTHMIRDIIIEAFAKNKASQMLTELRKAFAEQLIPDLDLPENTGEFADMFAQTLAYGLFAARINHDKPTPFKRSEAAREIPKTNPFLRRLFETITGTALDDEPFACFVDDLVQLLAHTDIEAVLENFGKRTKKEDPIVHFYETFLAAYDPKLRESRGVYYTPEPVVSYIVRSVDHLLKTRFDCPGGLADTSSVQYEKSVNGKKQKATSPKVLILDPACGTGTFLYAVVDQIREQFKQQKNAGMWSGYVRKHLLPRLFGFELLMAPYAVAHLKLGMQLAGLDLPGASRKKWAYDFAGKERLGIYLTNTLEEAEKRVQLEFGFLRTLAEEARGASDIKKDLPIMVVMGNPPYSGHSANRSWEVKDGKKVRTFIGNLLQDYYQVDGRPLGERNPKWLQDDYVKFIRFGQWRIEQTGCGILALITNNSYLDNPTFRGMRQQLMNSFTGIYILDLHGSSKKKEVCPDGSKDENVFDIQQGVGIALFVKESGKNGPAKVHHAELWGLRGMTGKPGTKYNWLVENDLNSVSWKILTPQKPYYLFRPQDVDALLEYQVGWKLPEAIPVNSVGIVTARDSLTIKWSAEEIAETVRDFISLPSEEARAKYDLGNDARDWKVSLAQENLRKQKNLEACIKPILYRPFDKRFTCYTPESRGFLCMPRPEVMRHMLAGENLGLITTRQTRDRWDALVTRSIVGHKSLAAYDINSLFPLYLYPDPKAPAGRIDEVWPEGNNGRRPNLSPEFVKGFADKLGLKFASDGRGDLKKTFGPEDIFAYAYAVFHCPTYRQRYAEFLKIDFPRLPLTSNRELFARLCELGHELVSLHLLTKTAANQPSYPVSGENLVEKVRYVPPGKKSRGQVWINKAQHFESVPPDVWNFRIGGYQVGQKWLKDRKGRKLAYDDLTQYKQIIAALAETISLMGEIDKAISKWPIE